ncbi:ribonuclease HII [Clostridium sp. MSJ-8]|uniref:ribonuclease HII n=1 Tax=Clostridium sp. MSJ-8 TaxID=2841510 RepID=UPI001C0EAE6F|nr:ribonuclease HII [Clostridium sp. MSJ-8]MBU5488664.1 ribonuclease HII [Clostridium sp. MSJ-8]
MNKIVIEEISKLNYKEVKELVSNIDVKNFMNTSEYEVLINTLKSDKRKNVNSLGDKLKKAKDKFINEIQRTKNMYSFDKSYGYNIVAGVDEVGRGPLAGPIVACAVILDLNAIDDELILELNDSKKLSKKKREELSEIIKEKALCYKIAECSNEEIDEKGISYCNNKVFLDSVNNLEIKPELVLSDGYLVKNITINNEAVIKGDTKSACIAAASIVAKVYRDNLMEEYAKTYPYYDFEENAGYGTSKHIDEIKKHGVCPIHRKCFLTKIMNK